MPLVHFDLASIFARAVEVGSAVVDSLPRVTGYPLVDLPRVTGFIQKQTPTPNRFCGVRGLFVACERLCQALTPTDKIVTDKDRFQAIEMADCSQSAITALHCIDSAYRGMKRTAEQMAAGGPSPSLDSPMAYLNDAARQLWAAMSAPEKAGIGDSYLQAARIFQWSVGASSPSTTDPPAAEVAAPPAGPDLAVPSMEKLMEQLAQAVGDGNLARIMTIAGRKEWPGNRRMEEILLVDRRFAGKLSSEWATLLGVTDGAVRGYRTWKLLQQGKKTSD